MLEIVAFVFNKKGKNSLLIINVVSGGMGEHFCLGLKPKNAFVIDLNCIETSIFFNRSWSTKNRIV